jgi:undecaprenyl-diphosphatase
MSDWWQVVLLGLVEGLTEFLPISSTGHLLIVSKLLKFEGSLGGTFEIFIQIGSVLAVLAFYLPDLLIDVRALPHDRASRRFWLTIAIACLPTAAVGLVLHSWIKQVLFASPGVIAWALIGGGLVLILIERRLPRPRRTQILHQIALSQALGIGLAQVFALIPGVSRSGATIVGGLLAGLDRPTATRFSFYLALPTLGAATLIDLAGVLQDLTLGDVAKLALGSTVAMLVAWVSIGWLLRYVAHHTFVPFGIYRVVAGVLILLLLRLSAL